ncbi:MAG: tyrosine-type recombinase/integrase [Candidatus Kapaibacterium sp.]|nr:tyrosine-type recombinase/integrase [Bacteroidota bacterium]
MKERKVKPVISDVFTPVHMSLSTMNEYLAAFLVSLKDKSKETFGTYQRCLRDFTYFFTVDKNFAFTVKCVERYKHYLIHEKKMAEVSMSQYLTSLRRFCNYLVETGVLAKNPAKRVSGGRRPKKHTRSFISQAEMDMLLKALEGDEYEQLRDNAIVRFMIGCAVSELELTRMDIGDLKHDGKRWTVIVQGKGKTVKDVILPVPQSVVDAVHKYLALRSDATPDRPMFLSRSNRARNGYMNIRSMREFVHLRLINSGIKHGRDLRLTPFSLRHTAGVMIAELGATVEELMQRLRLEWRPTAMIYFQQAGQFGVTTREDLAALVQVPKE